MLKPNKVWYFVQLNPLTTRETQALWLSTTGWRRTECDLEMVTSANWTRKYCPLNSANQIAWLSMVILLYSTRVPRTLFLFCASDLQHQNVTLAPLHNSIFLELQKWQNIITGKLQGIEHARPKLVDFFRFPRVIPNTCILVFGVMGMPGTIPSICRQYSIHCQSSRVRNGQWSLRWSFCQQRSPEIAWRTHSKWHLSVQCL